MSPQIPQCLLHGQTHLFGTLVAEFPFCTFLLIILFVIYQTHAERGNRITKDMVLLHWKWKKKEDTVR